MAATAIGFIIRAVISFLSVSVANHDTIGWGVVGSLTIAGHSIYPAQAHEFHAFFPLFLYIDALGKFMEKSGVPYMLVIKLVCSAFDAANIYLVYLLSYKNRRRAWIYALNPATILITSVHGQFESIPVFFLLLAVYAAKRKKRAWSGLLASTAVAFKTWPLMFLLPWIKRIGKLRFVLLLAVIPVLSIVVYMYIYKAGLWPILHETLFYRGQMGDYGIGYIFTLLTGRKDLLKLVSNIFLVTFVLFSVFNTRKLMLEEMLDQMIYFFCFSPTFGIQWLAWIIPFMIIRMPRYALIFLAATSVYVFIPNYFWWSGNSGIMKLLACAGILSWLSLLLVGWGRMKDRGR